MDRGPDAQLPSLAPVPAYPRRAVEDYLDDARRAEEHLQLALRDAEARRLRAVAAIDSAGDSHRLLGQMMVEAQQDLAARRRHAEEAARSMLASADEEATRILAAARAQVAALLGDGGLVASDPIDVGATATMDGDPADETPDPPQPQQPPADPPAATGARSSRRDATDGRPRPFEAVAAVAARPSTDVDLRDALVLHDGPRWRPRWRRSSDGNWPADAGPGDESFFSRLRDELRAEGTLDAWFEPA